MEAPDPGTKPSLTSTVIVSFPRLSLTAPGQKLQASEPRQPGIGGLLNSRPRVPDYEFIVRASGVWVRYPQLGVEVPMSGGGASGCFDADGVQRAWSREELLEMVLTPHVNFSERVPSAAPN
jgi:hypothetical protein